MKLKYFLVLAILISLQGVFALDLGISSSPIVNTIINDHEKPAIFEFTITNNDVTNDFEVYIFERFEISEREFTLAPGENKKLRIEFLPIESMKKNHGHVYVPVYFINKGGANPVIEKIDIEVIDFAQAFSLDSETLSLDSSSLKLNFYNIENIKYENLKVTFSGDFIDDTIQTFDLNEFEKKELEIQVNSNKLKKLVFGAYTLSAKIEFENKETNIETSVSISEKVGVSKEETKKGFIIIKKFIKKTNEGNTPTNVEIYLKKDIVSRLFTSFSLEPSSTQRNGFFVDYSWQGELAPDEELKVKVTTNWIYPILIVFLIVSLIYFINLYFKRHLIIKKNVSFVKTKSGDFALKVSLKVKAKKFIEKVSIFDRLPAMAKLYEHYGSPPTKVDKNVGKLRWDFKHLARGEERILTYIFYSKLKIIGKFELPSATGLYFILGKSYNSQSNRAFFINEPEEFKKPSIEED